MLRSQFDSDMLLMNRIDDSREMSREEIKTQIKKALYKVNPTAELGYVDKEKMFYRCSFDFNEETYIVGFTIPLGDIGDAKFHSIMEAKLLIRWLQ